MLKGIGEHAVRLFFRHLLLYVATVTFLQMGLFAQITDVTSNQSPPIPGAGHGYVQMLDATVNPSNGALSIRINVPVPSGRHLTVPFGFEYDSNAANFINYQSSVGNEGYLTGGGWSYLLPHIDFQWKDLSYYEQYFNGEPVQSTKYPCDLYHDYIFTDPQGGTHALYLALFGNVSGCNQYLAGFNPTNILTGGDGKVTATAGATLPPFGADITVSDASGTVFHFSGNLHETPMSNGWTVLPDWIEDSNGNRVTINDLGNRAFNMVDTLGRTVLASSGFGQSGNTVAVSGLSMPYTVTWGTAGSTWTANSSTSNDCTLSGCGGCSPIVGTGLPSSGVPVITAIKLPNGTSYNFSYDPTYGVINKIVYPNGGYVRYVWGPNSLSDAIDFYPDSKGNLSCHERYDTLGVQSRYVSFDGNSAHEYQEQDFSYATNWETIPSSGTPAYEVWNAGDKTTTIVTKDKFRGTSTNTLYSYAPISLTPNPYDGYSKFTYTGSCGLACNTNGIVWSQPVYREYPVEQVTTVEDGSGNILKTVTQSFADQFKMNCAVTDQDNVAISGTYYTWGAGDQLTDKKDYDFGVISNPTTCETNSPPSAAPSRETTITYAPFSTNPIGGSILNRPSAVQEYSSGTLAAETDYSYDQGGTVGASATQHDETNYGPGSTAPRGNATTVTKKCLQGCTGAVTSLTYDETGQVLSTIDPCGNASCSDMTGSNHTTTYSYTDNFTDSDPSGQTNAYLTTVTSPPTGGVAHIEHYRYRYSDGQLSASIDQNSQETDYQYNDPFNRLTETQYPSDPENGNQRPTTTYVYNDTAPTPTVTTTQLQNAAGQSKTSISTADGMGHVTLTQTAIGSGAYDNVSTVYDGEGLVYSVSNPYLTGGSQLLTLYAYDALGRVTSKTNPDQTTEKSSYLGNATTFTDENGNSWTRTYDSFGNLIGVVEPSPGTTTNYTYDALNDLTSVTQGIGTPETRSFTYDSLSRLLTATNPESGTIGYTYDANGNLFTRTDARGIKITYSYDDINRLLGKTYSDATYPVSYTYDTSSSPSPTNIIGRLTDEKTVVQGYTMTERAIDQYDVMGRIVSERQCFKGGCAGGTNYTLTHSYDLAGELVGSNNGMTGANAAAFVYGYDNAGRLNCVSTGSCTQPGTLFQATAYNAIGLTNANYATPVGGTAAFSQALTYDTRTRLTGETDTATNPTSGMPYSYAVGYDGVGNVTSMNDSIMGQWTFQTPGYDALNRLVNGAAITGPYANKYACWTYDAYGNQTMEAISSTACNNSPTPTTWAHYNTNNRITGTGLMPNGLGYDAAGDVTNDGVNMYEYDAEGRQTGVLSLTTMELTGYVYDAEGRRIEKVLVNGWNTPNPQSVIQDEYLLGLNNEQVSVLDGSGNWQWTNVYAGGKPLATYDSAGTHFTLTDWLGTKRMQLSEQISGTTATVTVGEQCTSLPFGDGLNCTGSDVNQLHFTGKERDAESGNDYFEARYYGSSMGRFMSPDPINLTEERLLNPANTLNKYIYGGNNPLKYIDDDGKDITVFYERPSLFTLSAGHILFTAENQQTGDAAVMSFGPIREGYSDTVDTLAGDSMVSTSEFGLAGVTADSLRQQYASLTIQTKPEEAQQVIDWIKQHGGVEALSGGYMLYDQNCTTVCREALKMINKLAQGNKDLSPTELWNTLFTKYADPYWHNKFGWTGSHPGVNYGQPRGGYDVFQLLDILSKQCTDSWDTSTNTLTSSCH